MGIAGVVHPLRVHQLARCVMRGWMTLAPDSYHSERSADCPEMCSLRNFDMRKPLIALFSHDTQFICDLPARGKDWFRFAVCEAIDEVEEFFSLNRAAALVADFRRVTVGQRAETSWFRGIRRRFSDMQVVVVASRQSVPLLADRLDDIALLCCDEGRDPTTELLKRLTDRAN